jgi:hypothetical protein
MAQAEEILAKDAERTARALLASADLFFNPLDGARTPEGLPIQWAVSFAIDPVLAKLDSAAMTALLAEAANGPSPMFASYEITTLSAEHGRVGKKEARPEDERRLPVTDVVELEGTMSARVARDAASGALLGNEDAAGMIWSWVARSGDEPVRTWIAGRLDEPDFARWVMRTFTSEGTSHVFGDMVGQRYYTVNTESLGEIVDVDRLTDIAKALVEDGKDPDEAAMRFIQGLIERY